MRAYDEQYQHDNLMAPFANPRVLITLIGSFAATYKTLEYFAISPNSWAAPFIMMGYAALICIIMWFFGTFLSSRY